MPGPPSRRDDLDDLDVRHVQPYQAVKAYRCPGCDHEIPPGLGHEVVVPIDAPDLRRHWHTPCWHTELRRRKGPTKKAPNKKRP